MQSPGKHAVYYLLFLLFLLPLNIFVVKAAEVEAISDTAIALTDINPEEDGEFSAFDFYVGGRYYGLAYGFFGDDWLALDGTEDVLAIIPAIKDKNALIPLLTGVIKGQREIAGVGKITADPKTFKITLEVAQELVLQRKIEDIEGLAEAIDVLAIRHRMGLISSAPFGTTDEESNVSLYHRTLFGSGRARLNLAGVFNKGSSYDFTGGLVERDFFWFNQEMTLSSGLTGTTGQQFASSLDIFGVTLATNEVVINRDPLLKASSVSVFLRNRAEIKVFKNSDKAGQLIYTNFHEFGENELDTRSFPMGSYNIVIVTKDGGGVEQRSVRPFTKSRRLAPRKVPIVGFEVGVLRDNLELTDIPVMQLSYQKRLSANSDGKASIYTTNRALVLELDLNAEYDGGDFDLPGEITTNLTLSARRHGGGGINAGLNWSAGSYSTQFRATKSTSGKEIVEEGFGEDEISRRKAELELQGRENIQLSFGGPLPFFEKKAQFNLSGRWSRNEGESSEYNYGPELKARLYDDGKHKIAMRMKATFNDNQQPIMTVSFDFSRNSKHWQQAETLDYRASEEGYTLDSLTSAQFLGNNADYDDWRNNFHNTTTLRMQNMMSNYRDITQILENKSKYEGQKAAGKVFVNADVKDGGGRIGGELIGTIIWTEDGLLDSFGVNAGRDSALVAIDLKGKSDAEIGISVNGSVKSRAYPGEVVYVALPTYQASEISLNIIGDGLATIDDSTRVITAYPGNVFHEVFDITRVFILFGRLVDENLEPVVNKRFKTPGGVSYTDEEGYFDIEAPVVFGEEFVIQSRGFRCTMMVPTLGASELMHDADDVHCKAQ